MRDDHLFGQLRLELERDRDELLSTIAEQDLDPDDPLLQMLQSSLEDLRLALSKFDTGEFGSCELCGAAVDERRLKSLPFTRVCRPCETMQTSEAPI